MNPPMEIWDIYEWRIVEICGGKPPRIILDIWSSLRSSGHSTCGRCVQSVKPTRTSRGRGQRTVVLPSRGGLDWLDAGTGNKNGNGTTDHSAFDQQSCSFRQNEEICCKKIPISNKLGQLIESESPRRSTSSLSTGMEPSSLGPPTAICSARKLRMFTCKVEDLTSISILAQSMAFTLQTWVPANIHSNQFGDRREICGWHWPIPNIDCLHGNQPRIHVTSGCEVCLAPSNSAQLTQCLGPFRSSDGAKHQINSPV